MAAIMVKTKHHIGFSLFVILCLTGCEQPIDLTQIKDLTTQGISAYKDVNGSISDVKDSTNTTLCPQTGIIGDANTYRVNEGRYALASVKCVSRQGNNVVLDITITYQNNTRASYQRNDPTNLVLAALHQNGSTEGSISSPVLLNPRTSIPNVTVSAVKFTLPNSFDIKADQIICGFQSPFPPY